MPRLALISDTHLSPTHGFFHANVVKTIAAVNAASPDLVVNCGDITINGAEDEADLAFAAHVHDGVAAPLAVIPGNHDVGEEPGALHADQPVDAARLARYRDAFGADWWARDLGAWRLIGINTMLFGTGLTAEARQRAWLEAALGEAAGRPIAVFTHKPLWLDNEHEAPVPEWTLAPDHRADVTTLFARARVNLVASGHLHQGRARLHGGALHVWTPSCAFPASHALGGDPGLGFAVVELTDDGAAAARFIKPAGLEARALADIKAESGARMLKDCPPSPVDAAD